MKLKTLLFDKNTYLSLLGILAVLYLFVATFPGAYHPIGTGLDPSWRYGLNYLSYSSHIFGRDVVFSYGPLGYLLNPVNIGSNVVWAIRFRLLLHVLLLCILIYYVLRKGKALQVIVFTVAYVGAFVLGIGFIEDAYEYSLVVITCLLTSVSALEPSKRFRFVDVLNGSLASSFLFMKFSAGLSSLAIITIYSIVRLIKKDPRARQSILVTAGAYLGMTIVIGAVYFKSPGNLFWWLRRSLTMADGYNVAMSFVGPDELVVQALIAVATYSCLLLLLYKVKARSLGMAFALSVPIFFAFKHGFVRQDGHMMFFYAFVLAAIGVIALSAEKWKELSACGVSLLIVGALAIPVASTFDRLGRPRLEYKIGGTEGLRHMRYLYYLSGIRKELNRQSSVSLEADRLPAEWIRLIKTNNSSVGTIPWELSYCAANDLACDPFPTLQMYAAYTSSLDQWSALHYRGGRAPEFLLLDFINLDQRNLLLDVPATWRAILQNYQVIQKISPQGTHLLQKRAPLYDEELTTIGQESAAIGDWVNVPSAEGLLYAFIDMRLRSIGWITKTAFRIPPVRISFLYASGKRTTHRIIPDTAQDGLLINYAANNMEELSSLFTHTATDRVVKFQISGPGASYYKKTSRIIWRADHNHKVFLNQKNPIDLNSLQLVARLTGSAIDAVNRVFFPLPPLITIDSGTEEMISVSGWAVDAQAKKPAAGVFVNIDGQTDIPAIYGRDRPDVAKGLKNSEYRFSGFVATLPTEMLGKGSHTLSLKIVTSDKTGYYESQQKVSLEIK